MRANQLRMWFASMTYVLIDAVRRIGLAHTWFAHAPCGTIHLKLLKIGVLVRTSERRIKLDAVGLSPSRRLPSRARRARCRSDGLTNRKPNENISQTNSGTIPLKRTRKS